MGNLIYWYYDKMKIEILLWVSMSINYNGEDFTLKWDEFRLNKIPEYHSEAEFYKKFSEILTIWIKPDSDKKEDLLFKLLWLEIFDKRTYEKLLDFLKEE